MADVVMSQDAWSDSDERSQARRRITNRHIRSGADTPRMRRVVRQRRFNVTRMPRNLFRNRIRTNDRAGRGIWKSGILSGKDNALMMIVLPAGGHIITSISPGDFFTQEVASAVAEELPDEVMAQWIT